MASSSDLFCASCGAANAASTHTCFYCGNSLPQTGPLLTKTGTATSTPVSTPTATASPTITGQLAHDQLLKGRYRILKQIGRGGFAAVYQAADEALGNRLVAIKEMSQNGLSSKELQEAIDAFKREALLLAGLTHPSLPRIYEHFQEAGHWYLVMDFIEGETLESRLQSNAAGRLPTEEAITIVLQLCNVLAYLHSQQPPIIFRDLKPTNIILTSGGPPSLIDFGIARHFKPGQVKDTTALGSPGYAAPEQYGKRQTTPQADIYSLGAILHQMLTGCDPSERPFHFAPLQLGQKAADRELEQLILQMVKMEEDERPESIAVVKGTLQHFTAQHSGQSLAIGHAQAQASPILPMPASHRHSKQRSPAVPQSPRIGTTLLTYNGHSEWIWNVAWSPDGQFIASASEDNTVQVWQALTGQRHLTYRGHSDDVIVAAWSPDGQSIASAGGDKKVHIWQALTGQRHLTYRGHSATVIALAWSPDGQFIASAGEDHTIQVWRVHTGQCLVIYRGHSAPVESVVWSPNGQSIASASDDKKVQVWWALTGQRRLTYRGHSDTVMVVAWSPDGQSIASAGWDRTVQIWQVPSSQRLLNYIGHSEHVAAVTWSPNGQLIASADWDKQVQVWQANSGQRLLTYVGHSDSVTSVAWSPDGQHIASSSGDKTVQIWQAT